MVYFTTALASYRYIHLTDDHLKGYSDAGPREKLSSNGDNLPNVLYYLHTKHPETLAKIYCSNAALGAGADRHRAGNNLG